VPISTMVFSCTRMKSADGPYFYDISGKKYIDFFMCNGAVLLGHNRPEVKSTLTRCLEKGYFAESDLLTQAVGEHSWRYDLHAGIREKM